MRNYDASFVGIATALPSSCHLALAGAQGNIFVNIYRSRRGYMAE